MPFVPAGLRMVLSVILPTPFLHTIQPIGGAKGVGPGTEAELTTQTGSLLFISSGQVMSFVVQLLH